MKCKICKRSPSEIAEYVEMAEDKEGFPNANTPEEIVRTEEGTFNPYTKMFYCTDCYFKAGMPLGTA